MPNVLRVFLENGQTKSFKYDLDTTVQVGNNLANRWSALSAKPRISGCLGIGEGQAGTTEVMPFLTRIGTPTRASITQALPTETGRKNLQSIHD